MGIGWAGWVEPIEFIGGSADPDPLGTWLSDLSAGEWADWDFSKGDLHQQQGVPTLATANGDRVGYTWDRAQWAGKTLAEVLTIALNRITGGDFESGLVGSKADQNGSVSTWGLNTADPIGGAQDGIIEITTSAAARPTLTFSAPARTVGYSYWWDFDYKVLTGEMNINSVYNGSAATAVGQGYTGAGKFEALYRGAGNGITSDILYFGNSLTKTQIDNVRALEIPGYAAYQTSSGDRLTYSISGARITATGDATGDNMLTDFLASSGENSIIIDADVPATLAATQMIAGLSGSSTARLSIGINTSGQLVGSVGNQTSTTILGNTDWRGQRLVACLSVDGDTVRLMAASVEYEDDQDGAPSTTIPLRLLATNNNGTAAGFFGGGVKRVIHAHKAMSAAAWGPIRAQLAAAA